MAIAIATLSLIISILSYRESRKNYHLTQTPVIIPTITKNGDKTKVELINTHTTGVLKHVKILFKRGKISGEIFKKEDLIPPLCHMGVFYVSENLDGCLFELNYKNIFDEEVEITGNIVYIPETGLFDLQNMKLETDITGGLRDYLPS